MNYLRKEKLCLFTTGIICLVGCAFLWIFNIIDAYYSNTEVIRRSEYSEALAVVSSEEETSSSSAGATININTASVKELADFLPGIGEKKAEKIVEYRTLTGGFRSVDELIKVDGIGEKTLKNISPYCRTSD